MRTPKPPRRQTSAIVAFVIATLWPTSIATYLLLAYPTFDYYRQREHIYSRACREPCRARLDTEALHEAREAELYAVRVVLLGPIAYTVAPHGSSAGIFMTAFVAAMINSGLFLCQHRVLRIALVAAGLVAWLMQGCLAIVIGM